MRSSSFEPPSISSAELVPLPTGAGPPQQDSPEASTSVRLVTAVQLPVQPEPPLWPFSSTPLP